MITSRHVHLNRAWKTPQFWLIWTVLCLNVTAGISVISMASPMLQDVFGGRLLGLDAATTLTGAQKAALVASAAGLVGLISLFNSLGRIFWASLSDFLGRKNTYFVFFALGTILYATVPFTGTTANVGLFVACFCVIISMYGGGFATVPAYLRDMFGTRYVGAIHGMLLTAWSAAGIFGPVLVNYIRQYNVDSGIPKAQAYNITMYLMAGLLVVGFLCNLFITAVNERHHMEPDASDAVGMAD